MTLADYSIYCNELWIRIISDLRLKNYAIIYEPGVNMVEFEDITYQIRM